MNRTTVSHDVFELYLYALNDATLYQQQRERIEASLQRRFDAGTYDNDKAVKLWRYFADNAAKRYNAEFCAAGKWHKLFDTATRNEVAQLCEVEHRELMQERQD